MILDNNWLAFLALLRAGLWETAVQLESYGVVDFSDVYGISEAQSVVGLVAAGIEQVEDVKVPQAYALQFVGYTLQIEQRNRAMNEFVGRLIEKLRREDVYSLLVKGQGVAQCYVRPLWRSSGDVDLLLSEDNYKKAKAVLAPLASSVERENRYTKHLGMIIDNWEVELHGNLRSCISRKVDRGLDEIADSVFYGGNVRSWMNGRTHVFLMGADCDVFYVFTHILQHFFQGGIGLRQVCDWCRLLNRYHQELDLRLLETRLRKAGIMTEWKTFAALAVDILGMQSEMMPLYDSSEKWNKKADRVLSCIVESGNFGHNIDNTYRGKYKGIRKRVISVSRYTREALQHFMIFPSNTVSVWLNTMKSGLRAMRIKK